MSEHQIVLREHDDIREYTNQSVCSHQERVGVVGKVNLIILLD